MEQNEIFQLHGISPKKYGTGNYFSVGVVFFFYILSINSMLLCCMVHVVNSNLMRFIHSVVDGKYLIKIEMFRA